VKPDAGLREAVDIRRAHFRVPIAPGHVGAEILGHDENDVGMRRNRRLLDCGGRLLGRGEHRRGQRAKQKMTAIQWHSTQYTPVARAVW